MDKHKDLYDRIRRTASELFMIVFTYRLELEDITDFRDYKYGVLYVTPTVSKNGVPCYTIIFINRQTHVIHFANTEHESLPCEAFLVLSQLEDNGKYFEFVHCHTRKYTEEEIKGPFYQEGLAQHIAESFQLMDSIPDNGYVDTDIKGFRGIIHINFKDEGIKDNVTRKDLLRLRVKEERIREQRLRERYKRSQSKLLNSRP